MYFIQEEGMLQVDEWAEIRRLHFAEGLGVKTIARDVGRARNTVRSAVRILRLSISAYLPSFHIYRTKLRASNC